MNALIKAPWNGNQRPAPDEARALRLRRLDPLVGRRKLHDICGVMGAAQAWKTMTGWNINPHGRGGFGDYPEHRLQIGAPGSPRCSATSKRSGKRCKMMPTNGYDTCYWHGARGGDPRSHRLPTSVRNLKNKEIKRGRAAAEVEADRRIASRELHPDTRRTFRALAYKVHPADQGRLMLAIDDYFNGSTTTEGWREARKVLGLTTNRASPTPALPASSPAETDTVELRPSGF
jgi:hypothetical protein